MNNRREGNTGYRKEVASRGIDAFVLGKASEPGSDYRGDYGTGEHVEDLIGNIPNRYRTYIDRLPGRTNVTFVKYEEMATNCQGWLEKSILPFPLGNKEKVFRELVALSPAFFKKGDSDVMQHVRHVTPGDHLGKLEPSTIEQLDIIFSDTLDALGYEKHS